MSGPPADYNDVAARIVEFREKHPEGSLQQVSVQFLDFAGKSWVVYTAAAFRHPDDPRPGHGTAWEPVPGPTPFTKDSEVQNAETSAWGRAIMAALAADARKGIASADEVRNRQDAPPFEACTAEQLAELHRLLALPTIDAQAATDEILRRGNVESLDNLSRRDADNAIKWLAQAEQAAS